MCRRSGIHYYILFIVFCLGAISLHAQERTGPLLYNPVLKNYKGGTAVYKTTADPLELPFFEDFTSTEVYDYRSYIPYPDAAKWADHEVYVNNTMCIDPISRGVATFDGINKNGIPYDPVNPGAIRYGDSLTSMPINLGNHQPSDSIYLSFFYQPQGNGFYPEQQDSLELYFRRKNTNVWNKVWAKEGSTVQPFQQVLIPVTDTIYFDSAFQFRFVNKVSMDINDDVWNLDYIRMDAGRNYNDTAINDIAFTANPTSLLGDYTFMPYDHYIANASSERASQITTKLRNNTTNPQTVNWVFDPKDIATGTQLATGSNSVTILPYSDTTISVPAYTTTVPTPPGLDSAVMYSDKFYINTGAATGSVDNDTIASEQLFQNEFAYDDGTAEQSYFLNLFTSLPAKLAIEYHLNHPDTIKGVAIYFGRQVPSGAEKNFSLVVYRSLGSNGSPDDIAYEEDNLLPGYLAENDFYVYQFQTPVVLPQGTFYIGTIQPAFSSSDSLYLGLDVNRTGGNHAYFNVFNYWQSSLVSGAIMIRPIVGPIIASSVPKVDMGAKLLEWSVSPNPVHDNFRLNYKSDKAASYEIYSIDGRIIKNGISYASRDISVAGFLPGIYFVRINIDGVQGAPQKIIKQ